MKKPIEQMTVSRLESTIENARKHIERHKKTGNKKELTRYISIYQRATAFLDMRKAEKPKNKDKFFIDGLKVILSKPYNQITLNNYVFALRHYLEHKT